jgi:uncharacterized protein YkwD
MDWVKDFYSKQTDWLGLADRWARMPVEGLQGRPVNRVNAIRRCRPTAALAENRRLAKT